MDDLGPGWLLNAQFSRRMCEFWTATTRPPLVRSLEECLTLRQPFSLRDGIPSDLLLSTGGLGELGCLSESIWGRPECL